MNWKNIDVFPIMGEWLNKENAIAFDLSVNNSSLTKETYGNIENFNSYIKGLLKKANVKYGYGGYFEDRIVYNVFDNFATSAEHRSIHLGIDIWAGAGTPVFAPMDGIIHSFQLNAGEGNYGPTIILEHTLDRTKIFSLYGHLSTMDLDDLYPGKMINQGELLCHLGDIHENGKWPPHLHFQLMHDMEGWKGDYPGVCSRQDEHHYRNNCPDPMGLIFLS
jgi:murein DD-endopeptidase MepM/ murein hydrolase activator NlpD